MHTFSTPAPITVEVRNASGDVHVTLADTDQTTVDVTLMSSGAAGFVDEIVRAFGGRRGDEADSADKRSRWWEAPGGPEASGILDRVRVDLAARDEGQTLIVDTDPASRGWRTSFAVRVIAPTGSSVRVNSQSADVTVSGTAGMMDIRTASGDVLADDARETVHIQTASGDVRLQSVGGDLSCRSASGDLEVTSVAGSTALHTTSGDVRVQAPAGDVEVRTVSGDVDVADLVRGLARVTTVSGDVELGVHSGSLAAVNLSTISGDTRSDLDISDRPAGGGDGMSPERPDPGTDSGTDSGAGVVSGAGADTGQVSAAPAPTLDIRARTTSGDIRLRRSIAA